MSQQLTGVTAEVLPLLRQCGLLDTNDFFLFIELRYPPTNKMSALDFTVTGGGYVRAPNLLAPEPRILSMEKVLRTYYERVFPKNGEGPRHQVLNDGGHSVLWQSGACFTHEAAYVVPRIGFAFYSAAEWRLEFARRVLRRLKEINDIGEALMRKAGKKIK